MNSQMNNNWGNWNTPVSTPTQPQFEVEPHIQQMLTNADLPISKDGLLMLQQRHKSLLDSYKESEMELRKLCAKFFVETPKEGVNTVDLGNGYQAKIGLSFNYNLDKDNSKIENVQDEIAKTGNEGAFIADRIITWEAHFSISEYRKLQEDAKAGNTTAMVILDKLATILTITDKAPTLDVKEPKAKRK